MESYFFQFISIIVSLNAQIVLDLNAAAAAAKWLQSCLTLCDPIDGSPPGSPIPGILQARTLEWIAISFSNAWKWKVKSLSRVWLLATPWTAAHQAPLFMGFPSQEYWSGVSSPWYSILWSGFCFFSKCFYGSWRISTLFLSVCSSFLGLPRWC